MIKKLSNRKTEKFCTLDIETKKDGDVLSICLFDGNNCHDFLTWDSFLMFLYKNNDNKNYHKIFAHFGGGFDWVSFVESQIDNLESLEIITSGSQIIFIVLNCFENPVILGDSILTLLKGLDSLCDVFKPDNPKLKGFDINNIETIFKNEPKKYYKYLHNDVISLYQIMVKFMDLLEIDFFPLTASSLAMYKFRKDFLDNKTPLFTNNLKKKITEEKTVFKRKWDEADKFIKDSYAGGRVECFRPGIYENVKSFDINSLYPFCMRDAQIPVCTPIKVTKFLENKTGFYNVEFNQTNKKMPPVLWIKKGHGLEFVYKGVGTFSSIEIENLIRVGGTVKVNSGYVYPKTAKVFTDYVNHYYTLRKKNPGSAMDYICKLLLNGLYGKFAELGETEKLEKITDKNQLIKRIREKQKVRVYDEDKNLYTVSESRDVPHRLIHVASIITALARTELYKYLEQNIDNLIYCDTDSVHLNNSSIDDNLIGDKLGQMKIEEQGKGVYIGRKQYAIDKKIKFKGLTLKDKLNPESWVNILTLYDMELLQQGGEKEYSFYTFPKIRRVLKGKKACKIYKITKQIKKPEYTTNFLK